MSAQTLSPPSRSFTQRTTDQRLQALERANATRSRRSALKRDLKAGRRSAVPLLADPPEWAATMKVIDVVIAMPKVGRVKAEKVLKLTATSPHKTLGGLSDRQRAALIQALSNEGWR